jgi:2-keto-4-pentenoate hydratase/2-oxohepta-3-ene-1,7-dioic acid hydratase in catechol pathway
MRIGQFTRSNTDESPWAGALTDDGVVDLAAAGLEAGIDLPRRAVSLLNEWRFQQKATLAVEHAIETDTSVHALADLDRHAPITTPRKVICVGLNYADHADESGGDPPDSPVLFAKFPSAITGPGNAIEWDPELTSSVDYEAELCAVIGERARKVSEAEAMAHVAGFTPGNDVSARDLQFADEQWVRGKSLDTFAPLGPYLVTTDEIDDVHDLSIRAHLDGETVQESTTANLLFDVPELVSFCSQAFVLEPGDVIFTGTPAGVGAFRDPPLYLEDGNEITVSIEGLGDLTNPCVHRR